MDNAQDQGDLFARGLEMRRAVLGAEYVEKSLNGNPFMEPLQKLITEWCWGELWHRPGIDRKMRSIVNIAMLAALNRPNELRLHLRGALNNGVTPKEIQEILLQVAVYCGVPAGLDGFKIASEVLSDASNGSGA